MTAATNRGAMLEKLAALETEVARAVAGGGGKYVERHHARGKLLPRERIALAVHAYGIAARSLALTAAYCRERETFGKPLIANQVVRHKLVEMHRQVEVARTYTHEVARRHVGGEDVIAEACLAKQTAVAAALAVCDRAVQLHGGTGYLHGTEVERHYRDARILPIGGGATEVLTDLASRLLGYS